LLCFCRAMLRYNSVYLTCSKKMSGQWSVAAEYSAVQARPMPSCGVCLSVTFVNSVNTNKHIFEIFSPTSVGQIIWWQTSWQYSDGEPLNGGVECRWGRQKSRFWANRSSAKCALHSVATDHGELMTLVAGKRRSLLMAALAGDNDEVYDKKPQRYAQDNVTQL